MKTQLQRNAVPRQKTETFAKQIRASSRHQLFRETSKKSLPSARACRPGWTIFLLTLVCSAHLLAQVPSIPTNSLNPSLDSWSFSDTNYWTSDLGYYPLSFTNLSVLTSNGPGNSLLIDSTNVSQLLFGTWNSDGTTNLSVTGDGSLMLWFNPNWSSVSGGGSGPGGQWSPVIDLGAYTSNANYGYWSCGFDSAGNNFYFITQDAVGDQGDYIYAPVTLTAGTWNLIALTWSSTNTTLYLNGAYVTNGPGFSVLPSSGVISNGFAIGSDAATGSLQMHGSMSDLTTYNYQLSAGVVQSEWVLYGAFYFGAGGGEPDIMQAPSMPEVIPTFDAVAGPGYLLLVSSNSGCGNNTNVWLTNTIAVLTNGAVNLTFTIAGGSNSLPYDVFAIPVLPNPLTNDAWTWMGQGYQCCSYTITNLTNSDVFLILGKPIDSDGDGLTDAYELLVSHTNPHNSDTSADGMLDGWKVLWGMNPLINNSAQVNQRANYTYDGTGRLETNSGLLNEIFSFDAEGNIQLDQP